MSVEFLSDKLCVIIKTSEKTSLYSLFHIVKRNSTRILSLVQVYTIHQKSKPISNLTQEFLQFLKHKVQKPIAKLWNFFLKHWKYFWFGCWLLKINYDRISAKTVDVWFPTNHLVEVWIIDYKFNEHWLYFLSQDILLLSFKELHIATMFKAKLTKLIVVEIIK